MTTSPNSARATEQIPAERDPSVVDPSDFDPSAIVFVTRNVTDAEIAAVTAVVRGLLREESDVAHGTPQTGRSAWEISQRSLRTPVHPGHGAWRGFPA